jgi:hypothetical protein
LSSGKLKIVPFLTLPTNRLSLYFDPRLSVCKNRTEVGAIVSIQNKFGIPVGALSSKVSNFSELKPGVALENPITSFHPLLKSS